MILVNHQPHYLPSVQYFARMRDADVFVLADDVQFCKQDWQNRNRILTPQGVQWVIVPVLRKTEELILEKKVDHQKDFRRQHIGMLRSSYGRSPGWKHLEELVEILMSEKWELLVDVQRATLAWFARFFGYESKLRWASELGLSESEPNRRLAAQCRLLGCDTYLHGEGARNYMDCSVFDGIRLVKHCWEPKEYEQKWSGGSFVPNLSVVDLIANLGDAAKGML